MLLEHSHQVKEGYSEKLSNEMNHMWTTFLSLWSDLMNRSSRGPMQCHGKNEDDKTCPRQAFFSPFSFLFPYHHYINMYCPAAQAQNSYTNNPASALYFSNIKSFSLQHGKTPIAARFGKKILTAWGSEKSGRSLNVRLKREAITHRWLIVWKVGIPYMII